MVIPIFSAVGLIRLEQLAIDPFIVAFMLAIFRVTLFLSKEIELFCSIYEVE